MKHIAIFGSTGSIGVQAVDVIERHPERFRATVLTCGGNLELLRVQIMRLRPGMAVAVGGGQAELSALAREFPEVEILSGAEGLAEAAGNGAYDLMLNALSGAAGLLPTWKALTSGRGVAVANKEALVAGGALLMAEAARRGLPILPVDSEHSAIFQALQGSNGNAPRRVLLTASGGPFRGFSKEMLRGATLEQALRHPSWNMGDKITVDSATMMNKGLEIIEAGALFGLPSERIEVLAHPQCIVHSMVEFADASVIAQLGAADMRAPIAYALAYPERLEAVAPQLDFTALAGLTFERVDEGVFACLRIAREAMKAGGSAPIAMNAANEILVGLFLQRKIGFIDIQEKLECFMQSHVPAAVRGIDDVLGLDGEARRRASAMAGAV
ncbi:MAG: 1-deoxy-D-xylulose-5-phosphate reductoisomerase [Clostridiales Family XIII bacterium]|jgi:1-deoxy-D-xylulose-5-phosphate reductoisomerase|nr:1-deoxy-D-xylulose-5-phosphate reductoisomerase [Clostridiales Family XIII bacterium]